MEETNVRPKIKTIKKKIVRPIPDVATTVIPDVPPQNLDVQLPKTKTIKKKKAVVPEASGANENVVATLKKKKIIRKVKNTDIHNQLHLDDNNILMDNNEELDNKTLISIKNRLDELYFRFKKGEIPVEEVEREIERFTKIVYNEFEKEEEINYKYYPSLNDPFFSHKLLRFKEFNQNKIPKVKFNEQEDLVTQFEREVKKLCQAPSSKFKKDLLYQQKLLRNYLSPNTPYNSLLVFHGTGVGKTCTTISIAEQFKHFAVENGKKIYILSSEKIEDNFRKEIFSGDKNSNNFKCTGDTYIKELEAEYGKPFDELSKDITNLSKVTINKYYDFYGVREFANKLKHIYSKVQTDYERSSEQVRNNIYIDNLREFFDNTLLIIDEVHNIRKTHFGKVAEEKEDGTVAEEDETEEKTAKDKDIVNELEDFLLIAQQNHIRIKLILLSATPMFNNPNEIVWITNLMLMNDGIKKIKENEVFKDSKLLPNGEKILIKSLQGRVSYLRSENPFSFPFRLYPIIDKSYNPEQLNNLITHTQTGELITSENKFKSITLILSQLREEHYRHYKPRMNVGGSEDEEYLNGSTIKTPVGFYKRETELLNFCPYIGRGEEAGEQFDIKNFFRMSQGPLYSYESRVLSLPQYQEYPPLHMEVLDLIAPKIKTILECVMNSSGIVFVYSQFISFGSLLVALALEQNGFTRYNASGPNLLKTPDKGRVPLNGMNYILLTGSKDFKQHSQELIDAVNMPENSDGSRIKVVIGTEVVTEGIDFKNLREIHILEPWYNMNRLEQTVGRAIRTCSHASLDMTKRNVNVFYHAIKLPEEDQHIESTDVILYRIAESKQSKISNVETILRDVALDCSLNKNGNYFNPKDLQNMTIEITDSQNMKRLFAIGDTPGSKACMYQNSCNYVCYPPVAENLAFKSTIVDLYRPSFAKQEIRRYLYRIEELFQKDFAYSFRDIEKYIVSQENEVDRINLIYTLQYILENKTVLTDKYERKGNIIYKGMYYIFQPLDLNDMHVPMHYRKMPIDKYTETLNLSNVNLENETKKIEESRPKDNSDSSTVLSQLVTQYNDFFKSSNFISASDVFANKKEKLRVIFKEHLIDSLSNKHRTLLLRDLIEKYYKHTEDNGDFSYDSFVNTLSDELQMFIPAIDLYIVRQQRKNEPGLLHGYEVIGYQGYDDKESAHEGGDIVAVRGWWFYDGSIWHNGMRTSIVVYPQFITSEIDNAVVDEYKLEGNYENKNGSNFFKIKDVSKLKNKGRRCIHFEVDVIKGFISRFMNNLNESRYNDKLLRENYCLELQLLLRNARLVSRLENFQNQPKETRSRTMVRK